MASLASGVSYRASDFAWPDSPGIGHLGLYIDDDISHTRLMSSVRLTTGTLCSSLDDPVCATQSVRTYSILEHCATDVQTDCVEMVSATPSGAAVQDAVFSRYFPEQGLADFEGLRAANIPTGGSPSIWTLEGAPHNDGNEYMVIASVAGTSTYSGGRGALTDMTVHASLYPVKVVPGNFTRNVPPVAGSGASHTSGDKWSNCAYLAEGYCAVRQEFPVETSFALSLRLSSAPTGWLHGRIYSPNITYESLGASTRLKVNATPVKVAAVASWGRFSELPSSVRDSLGVFLRCDETVQCSQLNPQSAGAHTAVENWRPVYGDKAAWVRGQWMYQTLTDSNPGSAYASCTQGAAKLFGFVTTNATGYAPGPPTFDVASRSLSYVVASPHVDANGSLIVGTYDLVMRAELASCLYGANAGDLAGNVSVLYDSVAATNSELTQTVTNDGTWLHVSAAGFHYSMPTIKTTLTAKPIADTRPVIKRSATARWLATRAKLALAPGSKLSLRVYASSRNNCRVVGTAIKVLKTGTCRVKVTATPKKGKTIARSVVVQVVK